MPRLATQFFLGRFIEDILFCIQSFFGCQLPGYVSRAVRASVSYNNTKRTIPRSWKATKTFTIIGQNNETNESNKFENKGILRGRVRQRREIHSGVGLPVFWLVCLVSGWFFGGAVLLLVLFCWLTGIPLFFAFRMHKVVINSKTVTIVMMSAAMEQKNSLHLRWCISPLFNWLITGDSLYDYTARRCCLYRAMVQEVYLYVVYPTHCHARLGCNTSARASRWP